jgi:Flp pilus assembly protein TadD
MPAAGVFAVAIALRLLHLVQLRRAPFFDLLVGDASAYDAWARRIAAGDWLGSEVFYQAPLYPYLLGAWYALAGPGLIPVRILQATLGALACALVTVAAGRIFGRRAGIAAGLLFACYGPAIFFDALLQKSVLDALLVSLLLLLVSLLIERPSGARCLWTGVTLGLLALSRENALVLLPVILVWLWLRTRRALVPVLLAAAGVAAVLAPVALRNRAIGGELLLTTSQLGPNLYIGNHEGATGTYVPLRYGRGSASYERGDAVELAEAALGRRLSPAEVSRYWRDRALTWIADHPGAWLELQGWKLLLAWSAEESMDTEDLDTHADWSRPLRWTAAVSHFGVLAPLALLGIWWTRARWRELWVLHASIVAYVASVVAFYVVARYRYPLVPMLAPFAGAALAELPGRWRRGPNRERIRAFAILGVAVLVTRGAPGSPAIRRALTNYNYGRALQSEGRTEEAMALYRLVLELDPANAGAHTNLGVLCAERGEREAALLHFRAAAESAPDEPRNHANLGAELATQGRTAEAIASFERALELDPRDAGARFNLGTALAATGRSAEAIAQLGEAIRLEPDNARAHNNLGILLASTGRPGEAIARFESALRLDPAFHEAAANLARARELASARRGE